MGFIDFIKGRFQGNAEPEYDYDEYDDEFDEEEDYDDEEEETVSSTTRTTFQRDPHTRSKVVSISTTAQLNVVLFNPKDSTECTAIADCLLERNAVVLNLENATKESARRIVDFLLGVAYAHKGKLKRIAHNTYIITPYNVGLVGTEVIGELENNGVFF